MRSDSFLELLGEVREDFVLEAMDRSRRRLPVGKLLLAAALLALAVGGAVAARQSRLLDHIFRNAEQPPTPAVEAHLVQLDGEAEAAEDISFRVDEYLLDDDTLYLSWTAENRTGEPLIFFGPFIEGPGEYEFFAGMLRTALGGEVLGQALPEAYGETSQFHVTGAGGGPVKVTMLAQAPVAPFVDVATSSPTGTPVIAWNTRDRQVESYCYGFTIGKAKTKIAWSDGQVVEDVDDSQAWTSTHFYYDDRDALPAGDVESMYDIMLRDAEADEQLGYARLAKRWDVDLTLEKGAKRRQLAGELPRFELEDRTVVITELTQTDVMNRLRFQVVPKGENGIEYGDYGLYVNGATEEPEGIGGWSYRLDGGWQIDGLTPVEDAQGIVASEYEWLNDGEAIREIRLAPRGDGGGEVVWKLP